MQRQGSLSPPPPSNRDDGDMGSASEHRPRITTTAVVASAPDTVPEAASNPPSAMLYTLLQDLGLTATAQALCDELQRQQQDRSHTPSRPAPLISPPTPPLPSHEDEALTLLPPSESAAAVAAIAAVREAAAMASVPPPTPPSTPPMPITTTIGNARAALPASPLMASNTNTNTNTIAAGAAARRPRRPSPVTEAAASELSTEMQRKLQPYRHDSLCMKAVASLAACAVEPLHGISMGVNPGSAASLSSIGGPTPTTAASAVPPTITATTPSQLVTDLLPPLWHAEMRTACRGADASIGGGTVTPPSRMGDSLEIATLIARAAWCELRITELVFTQEYQLGHAANSAAVAAAMHVMQDAQRELADLAGQLVAALQELHSACGSIVARRRQFTAVPSASSGAVDAMGGACDACSSTTIAVTIAARLHHSSIEWLRNAECIMAWVLRRHSAFEAPAAAAGGGAVSSVAMGDAAASTAPQQRQQRKRRCLEQQGSPTEPELPSESARAYAAADGLNGGAVPPLLQPLQDVVMGLPFAAPAPSFQQCLEAEVARTAGAAKHSTAHAYADVPAPSLFAAARVPAVVRIAMTVQRVKLLQTLMGLLVTNGHDSVLGAFVASPSAMERVRPWWARQSAMLAQFTLQCSRMLGELAAAAGPASSSPRPRGVLARTDAATSAPPIAAALASLRELLELQSRDALGSVSPVRGGGAGAGATTPPPPEESRLSLCVRILNAMQSARDTRAAQLDRFALRTCTAAATAAGSSAPGAAAAAAAMASSSPLTAAVAHEAVFSPLSSVGSPTFGNDASPMTSTVWKVRVPTPPGSALRAPAPAAAGGLGEGGGEAEAGSLGRRGSIGSGSIGGGNNSGSSLTPPPALPSQPATTATGIPVPSAPCAAVSPDSLEAARTAAQVLQWKPHFTELLATIATGRWQAPQEVPQAPYPSSRYHRLRLRLKESMRHAQELLRVQPRPPIGARGVAYPPHPTARDGSGEGAVVGVPLSVVEQLPYVLQLATLQAAPVVQRRVRARLDRASARRAAAAARRSGSGGERGGSAPAAPASAAGPRPARRWVSPPSAAQPLLGEGSRGGASDARSAPALLAAATAVALRRARQEAAAQSAGANSGERCGASGSHGGGTTSSASAEAHRGDSQRRASAYETEQDEEEGVAAGSSRVERSPEPRPTQESDGDDAGRDSGAWASQRSGDESGIPDVAQEDDDDEDDEDAEDAEAPQLERWHLYDEEAMDELEREGDEEDDDDDGAWSPSEGLDNDDDDDAEAHEEEEDGSEASSADMDYERAEDTMKEEVECLEVTSDGRLLAMLTARGHLTVFRLQARDSVRRYEEELLLDATLPDMPSRAARLQWYEALSSFVHFSPCHRFLLAAVQFAPVELKSNASYATARAPAPGTGTIHLYSLHRAGRAEGGADEDAEEGEGGGAARGERGASGRLGRLVGCTTDRLYSTAQPHNGACLSARWVDPRWWSGGRRSRWANSAAEPLNTTSAASVVLAEHLRARSTSREGIPDSGLRSATSETPPASWRAAAAVLLSEYQCISISTDDCIVRWLPASGLVLQRIMTEPVHDIVVSPLMAAFYVASDAGELYMYDAWDERNVTDGGSHDADAAVDPCGLLGAKPPHSTQAQRLILPVTEEGHPRYHRIGRTQPFARVAGDGGAAAATGAATTAAGPAQRSSQLPARRGVRRESSDDPEAYEQVHAERTSAHFSGPVTPVFQRVILPVSATTGGPLQPQAQQHPSAVGSRGGLPLTSLHRPGVPRGTAAASRVAFNDDDDYIREDSYDEGENGDEEGLVHRGPQQQQRSPGGVTAKGLPRHLRWLLPQQWAAHTPWDAQLGRRLIRNLLRQTHTADCVEDGELVYERDVESTRTPSAAAFAALRARGGSSEPPLLVDVIAGADRQRPRRGTAARTATSGGAVGDEEGYEVGTAAATATATAGHDDSSDEPDVDVPTGDDDADLAYGFTDGADYDDDDDGARRPLPSRLLHGVAGGTVVADVTTTAAAAAAAASGAQVSVLESAAHPTPARGPLQRAYYPSGTCLVYKSVARALCSAGDLLDRQTHDEMGSGGSTHHLLSMAFSGEPQWTARRRLWERAAEEAGVLPAHTRQQQQPQQLHGQLGRGPREFQRSSAVLSDDADFRSSGATGRVSSPCDAQADDEGAACSSSAPPTPWSTAALARILLWRDDLQSLRQLASVPQSTWAAWESRVLATTYHADVAAAAWPTMANASAFPGEAGEAPAVRWSAMELLAARGYISPRDAWRRCAPSSQRGLAATARNGRYLCIMASVGPYRKLVNPREPLRDMPGFYGCVVFDVYAGAVLRVIPVCPTELTGLQGRSMWTSERHESDLKAPVFRLPCTVTVVPLPPAETGPSVTHGSGSPVHIRVGSTIDAAVSMRSGGDFPNRPRERVGGGDGLPEEDEEEEDGEPTEVVALTIGGLGNAVYVFDALTGRRLVCEEAAARHAGESAAAAYEAAALAARTRAATTASTSTTTANAAAGKVEDSNTAGGPAAAAAAAARLPVPPPPEMPAAHRLVSPVLPASIRKPSDVLASVATWGRGTGFDGITDRSSSATSSPDPFMAPAPYDEETAVVDGQNPRQPQPQPQPQQQEVDASLSSMTAAPAPPSPHTAEAAAESSMPWLLQNPRHNAAAAQGSGWSLRGILWWVHEHPQPATLYSHDEGSGSTANNGGVEEQEAAAGRHAVFRGNSEVAPSAARRGNGAGRVASTTAAGQRAAHTTTSTATAASGTVSAASSALAFFYQTLLGVSGMTGRRATPQQSSSPAAAAAAALFAPAPTPAPPQQQQQRLTTSPVVAHGPVWRQRRRRLLARLQRHYDPGMLWQAYVTLFAASMTSPNSLAPLSAVAALVQWALSIDEAATPTAAALLGPSLRRRSPAAAGAAWVWCAPAVTGSSGSGSGKVGAASRASVTAAVPWYEMQLPQYNSAHRTRATLARTDRHDASAREGDDGQCAGVDAAVCHSAFPFAHILQQREDLMLELQALEDPQRQLQQQQHGMPTRMAGARATVGGVHGRSLLAAVRAQAMEEGMLPLTAKARSAQQQERHAAAARDGTRPAAPAVRLPASHHQNQLHVDVVNCVATWYDASGGFYVCCGSEDGGLYIMGGNIAH